MLWICAIPYGRRIDGGYFGYPDIECTLVGYADFNNTDLIHEKIEAYYRDRQKAMPNVIFLPTTLRSYVRTIYLKRGIQISAAWRY